MPLDTRDLNASCIGKRVVYTPLNSRGVQEEGVITSFNDIFIFVRYDGDTHSKATYPHDLEWWFVQYKDEINRERWLTVEPK